MIPILSIEQTRQAEADADAHGHTYAAMMQAAGAAVAARAVEIIAERPQAQVTVLVGSGNNGGDGLVAAAKLKAARPDAQVRCYLLKAREDAQAAQARDAGVMLAAMPDDNDGRVIKHMTASADLVIDALFGIGVRLPLPSDAQKLLRFARQALNERRAARRSRAYIDPTRSAQIERPPHTTVLALDCPSGLDCDTGDLDSTSLHADETMTFIAAKPGLLRFPGAAAVGRLWVAPIDVPSDLPSLKRSPHTLLHNDAVRSLLPPRPANAHKGSFGTVLIVGGSRHYSGAPGLAAMGAYRSGAGLVSVAAPEHVTTALAAHITEATWLALPNTAQHAADMVRSALNSVDALLIGPGLGRTTVAGELLTKMLNMDDLPPVILDADALNLLSEHERWWTLLPANSVLTPHPGEMARLLGTTVPALSAQDPRTLTAEKAAAWNTVLVLKGAHTVIAAPSGMSASSPFKLDALATAGSGDVLAGVIAGLVAQGLSAFDAAQLGVYVHALAGQQAAEQIGSGRGVTAADAAAHVAGALATIELG